VVALGKLRILAGDEPGMAELAAIAKVMLQTSAPSVQSHAAWYLALHAMSLGKAVEAHDWLCVSGHDQRLDLFPLFPFEVADDVQLVRIAAAVGDQELAEHTIEQAEHRSELNPGVASFEAAAAHARGLWRSSTYDLETAASLFETGPRPLATASALEDLGRVQASEGATGGAIASLDRALAISHDEAAGSLVTVKAVLADVVGHRKLEGATAQRTGATMAEGSRPSCLVLHQRRGRSIWEWIPRRTRSWWAS
jgi:hypothetical protein